MKTIANLITSLIIASWLGGIAIFSIQNIQPVAVKFLWFESIQLTTGTVFAFSVGIGFLLGGIITASSGKKPAKVQSAKRNKSKSSRLRRDDFTPKAKPNEKEDWTQKPSEEW
jgi:uncharacterized integral membrane protein